MSSNWKIVLKAMPSILAGRRTKIAAVSSSEEPNSTADTLQKVIDESTGASDQQPTRQEEAAKLPIHSISKMTQMARVGIANNLTLRQSFYRKR